MSFVATDPQGELTVVTIHDPAIDHEQDGCDVEAFARSRRTAEDETKHLRFHDGKNPARWTHRTLKASVSVRIEDGMSRFANLPMGSSRGRRTGSRPQFNETKMEVGVNAGHLEAFRCSFVRVEGYEQADSKPIDWKFDGTGLDSTLRKSELDRWFSGGMTRVAIDLGGFILSSNTLREDDRSG